MYSNDDRSMTSCMFAKLTVGGKQMLVCTTHPPSIWIVQVCNYILSNAYVYINKSLFKRKKIYLDMHVKQNKIQSFNTLMLILSPALMQIYYSVYDNVP